MQFKLWILFITTQWFHRHDSGQSEIHRDSEICIWFSDIFVSDNNMVCDIEINWKRKDSMASEIIPQIK